VSPCPGEPMDAVARAWCARSDRLARSARAALPADGVGCSSRRDRARMRTREATLEDLARVPGKAELVNGRIVRMSPTGGLPGYAGREIVASLHAYSRRTGLVDAGGRSVPRPYHFSYCTARRS